MAAGVSFWIYQRDRQQLAQIQGTETATVARLNAEIAKLTGGNRQRFRKKVEVKGLAETPSPLTAPVSQQACIAYTASITEHYEEVTTDSEGRVSTQTSTKVIWEDKARIGFQINDGTGSVTVMPGGATLEETSTVNRYEVFGPSGTPSRGYPPNPSYPQQGYPPNPNYPQQGYPPNPNYPQPGYPPNPNYPTSLTLGGMHIPLGIQPGDRKVVKGHTYKETAIAVGSRLYVLGEARIVDNQLAIAKPSNPNDPFLISVKSEEEIVAKRQESTNNALAGAIAGAVFGLLCILMGLAGR